MLLADFEKGYGDWVAEGAAFAHPATRPTGATGFVGKGLADSWEASREIALSGSLTSPVFTLERNFIRFLVGGRGFSPKSSLQLLIDGKLECYACGVGDRERRIFFQYDPAADIQRKGGFGSDMDAVMSYVLDAVSQPGSQLDAICIDVSNEATSAAKKSGGACA
jgi:hypothetical protein